MLAQADEQSPQLAERRERLALSAPTLRDLLPQLEQTPTPFGWQFIHQLLDFIQHLQPFFRHRFSQFTKRATDPAPDMKLADLVLQTQLFCHLAEACQVVAYDHTHSQPLDQRF